MLRDAPLTPSSGPEMTSAPRGTLLGEMGWGAGKFNNWNFDSALFPMLFHQWVLQTIRLMTWLSQEGACPQ